MTYIINPVNTILMGALVTYHEARPNAVHIKATATDIKGTTLAQGLEYVLYIEDGINIKNKLRINPGFRLNFFSVPQKTYILPEPRLSVGYYFRKDLSLKASYAMMNQYMLMLSSSTIGLPTDLWVPITKNIRPQRSQQVALGLVYEPKKLGMTFSIEGYYKKLEHIIAYLPGASFMRTINDGMNGVVNEEKNLDWESQITTGQGWSYGVEFLARRTVGKFTGWVGYTLSWTQHRFKELNFGEKFWARNDRRHDVSIVLMYSLKKNINLSVSWVYATGDALTLPDETFLPTILSSLLETHLDMNQDLSGFSDLMKEVQGMWYVENYGAKNSFRAEAFHHLDISAQFIRPHKKNKRFESIFEVSIYNVYAHKNPFIYLVRDVFEHSNDGSQTHYRRLAKLTIFPIIPSFTYSLRF